MADYSFDIVADFDKQELVNTLDQVRRELTNRYDFKNSRTDITLENDKITIITEDTMKLEAIHSSLFAKATKRGLSVKIFDIQKEQQAGGSLLRQEIRLRTALSQDVAKKILKKIKDHNKKVKVSIQGDVVRVADKDKDVLQSIIAFVKTLDDIDYPLTFTNYR